MIGGTKWFKMGKGGARLNFIKYLLQLFQSKLRREKKPIKTETNKAEINQKKIIRNKFGFPTID